MELIGQYQYLLFIILITAVVSFVLTPLTGILAQKIGALDMPSGLRSRTDTTRLRRIHSRVMPTIGGLAVAAAFIFGLVVMFAQDQINFPQKHTIHILLGAAILVAMGLADSIWEVPAKWQFLIQILVALFISSAGIKIYYIEILHFYVNFDIANFVVQIGNFSFFFSPLADLITVIWIVGMINAINWVSGIDGLAAAISFFASMTMMFIGVKFGILPAAAIAAALAGSILGFFPFNFPPAKTFNGSSGDMLQGYLISILAIISGAKLSASIILLALPILDAVWVLVNRYRVHKREIKGPLDILQISDKTHLHHRLMQLGFSVRKILLIEVIIFLMFAISAYYLAGFSTETIFMLVAVVACLCIFIGIAILRGRAVKRGQTVEDIDLINSAIKSGKLQTEKPEDKYAY